MIAATERTEDVWFRLWILEHIYKLPKGVFSDRSPAMGTKHARKWLDANGYNHVSRDWTTKENTKVFSNAKAGLASYKMLKTVLDMEADDIVNEVLYRADGKSYAEGYANMVRSYFMDSNSSSNIPERLDHLRSHWNRSVANKARDYVRQVKNKSEKGKEVRLDQTRKDQDDERSQEVSELDTA
ncbi:MAG: hypothetical protein AAGM67_14900, partial [Bacteroidota bacterium]